MSQTPHSSKISIVEELLKFEGQTVPKWEKVEDEKNFEMKLENGFIYLMYWPGNEETPASYFLSIYDMDDLQDTVIHADEDTKNDLFLKLAALYQKASKEAVVNHRLNNVLDKLRSFNQKSAG